MARRRGTQPRQTDAAATKPRRDYGDGSVYERKDGRWVAQIPISDHPRRFRRLLTPRGTNTRQAALKLLDQLKQEKASGRDVATGRVALDRWMEEYLNGVVRVMEKSVATQEDYEYLCKYLILPDLAKARIETITERQLERWREQRLAKYSPSVVKRAASLLKRALAEAHERGALPRNPARNLSDFEAPTEHAPILDPAQVDAVVAAAAHYRVGLAVIAALRLGLRLGEALALRWSDYDRTAKTMAVLRQVTPDRVIKPPKYNSVRTLPVPPDLAALLDAAYDPQRPFGYICTADDSDLPIRHDNARRALRAVLAAAKHPNATTWHGLRHTLGSRLTDLNAAEAIIGAILGHKGGGSVTAGYSHAGVEALRSWVDAAERIAPKQETEQTG